VFVSTDMANTIIVGNLKTPLSWIGRYFSKKNQQRNFKFNVCIDQKELTDIYKMPHTAVAQ
jgi:hypothetical protein